MSIATAITNLQSRVADAYTSVGNKGGTIPQTQDTLHLPAAIASIPSGGASSKFGATIEQVFQTVTENDETTLTMFGGVTSLTFTGVTKIPNNGMAYKFYGSPVTSVSFPALTSAGTSAFQSSFQGCTSLTSASFPVLTTVSDANSFQNAFNGCTSLTSVSFPALTTVSGFGAFQNAFKSCTSLTSVSFPKLTSATNNVFQNAFEGCTSLTSVSFPEVTSANSSAFQDMLKNCDASGGVSVSFPKLEIVNGSKVFAGLWNNMTPTSTTVSFPELTAIKGSGTTAALAPFSYCTTITRFDFPKLVIMSKGSGDATDSMYLFNNCTNLVEIHFGADNQAVIEASSGYATKWGAPNANCTIYFDL